MKLLYFIWKILTRILTNSQTTLQLCKILNCTGKKKNPTGLTTRIWFSVRTFFLLLISSSSIKPKNHLCRVTLVIFFYNQIDIGLNVRRHILCFIFSHPFHRITGPWDWRTSLTQPHAQSRGCSVIRSTCSGLWSAGSWKPPSTNSLDSLHPVWLSSRGKRLSHHSLRCETVYMYDVVVNVVVGFNFSINISWTICQWLQNE